MTTTALHREHSRYSDPGEAGHLLAGLPVDPPALSAVARNVIVHYRAQAQGLPESSNDDINLRWMDAMLAVDSERHGAPLTQPREQTQRLQGCCRDHTLLCVAALRHNGVPARSRVGFAGYFTSGWHHDHVIVEAWLNGRWRRFDPELADPIPGLAAPAEFDFDEPGGAGFVTAAQAWLAHRAGALDSDSHGVDPHVPDFRGEQFLADEVIYEVAHRFGDELLLWDAWGLMKPPGTPVSEEDAGVIDEVATMLVAADGGDNGAEQALLQQYQGDARLHPGDVVMTGSPRGDGVWQTSLTTRSVVS